MSDPKPIEIEEAEVERLIEQARQGQLDAAAQQRIVPLLRTLVWLQRTLLETRISLAKLRKILFGKRTEKAPRKPEPPPDGSTDSSDGTKNTSAAAKRGERREPSGHRSRGGNRDGGAGGCWQRRQGRHHDRGMVASGRRIIPAPRRAFVPTTRSRRARCAPPAGAVDCIRWSRWCACVSPANRWCRSPTGNWSGCAAGLAAPYRWPTCRRRRTRRPMRSASR